MDKTYCSSNIIDLDGIKLVLNDMVCDLQQYFNDKINSL